MNKRERARIMMWNYYGGITDDKKIVARTASGDIATFNTNLSRNLKSLIVNIQPSESGWTAVNVARTGKNLLPPFDRTSATNNGITLTNENGVYTLNGTASANAQFDIPFPTNLPGNQQYTMQAFNPVTNSGISLFLITETGLGNPQMQLSEINVRRTPSVISLKLRRFRIRVSVGTTLSDFVFAPVITVGTEGVSDFEPYIGTTYPVTLPFNVNEGTLDVTGGVLTTGGNTYSVTPIDIPTLTGVNNIWADAGPVIVEYYKEP